MDPGTVVFLRLCSSTLEAGRQLVGLGLGRPGFGLGPGLDSGGQVLGDGTRGGGGEGRCSVDVLGAGGGDGGALDGPCPCSRARRGMTRDLLKAALAVEDIIEELRASGRAAAWEAAPVVLGGGAEEVWNCCLGEVGEGAGNQVLVWRQTLVRNGLPSKCSPDPSAAGDGGWYGAVYGGRGGGWIACR